ncbi:hypothetical protein HK101_006504 [Irineochytrium annulatum]|nr:hypothetical protein HK101_006504 [Irineochytrium annulatum]
MERRYREGKGEQIQPKKQSGPNGHRDGDAFAHIRACSTSPNSTYDFLPVEMQLKSLFLTLLAFSGRVFASDDAEVDVDDVPEELPLDIAAPAFQPTTLKSDGILEQFTQPLGKKWIVSTAKKVVDGIEDEALLAYRGQWAIEEATVYPGFAGDKGLVVKTPAAHHAISSLFPNPLDNTGKTLVVQYEVKLQNGLECGGAYMKLLTYDESFTPENFNDKTPYTIMFGPDRCGSTNKVHFIFRHLSPLGDWEEKHVNSPPIAKTDKTSSLYTLIVRPDNSFEMLVNNESVKKGSLLEDFTPAVNPPKEIDDPEDTKPSDWVDVAKIADPTASKPADWDEDAPLQIEDADAQMPEDWLEDEPAMVPDPTSEKPDDWDDEEDGDWVAPTVENPKCGDVSGCGPWKRPMKPNPDYKGKWKAPMIDNPDYKGVWAPRKIPNPKFFEDLHPSNFNKIFKGAIGFELWTMQDKILFDNIYVGHSEKDAKALREETWVPKVKLEKEVSKADTAAEDKPKATSFLERAKEQVYDFRARLIMFVRNAQIDPVEAVKEDALAAGSIAALVIWVFYSLANVIGMYVGAATGKKSAAKGKKTDEATPDDQTEGDVAEEPVVTADVDEKKGATKRSAAKKADD